MCTYTTDTGTDFSLLMTQLTGENLEYVRQSHVTPDWGPTGVTLANKSLQIYFIYISNPNQISVKFTFC